MVTCVLFAMLEGFAYPLMWFYRMVVLAHEVNPFAGQFS